MATILITGANRGIGLELARQYDAAGHDVIATARKPESAGELNATGADVHALDVSDPSSVGALASKIGDRSIDILINNAGVYGGDHQAVGDLDYQTWAHTMEVNTFGPMRMIDAFRENVAASDGKMIANVSSQMGSIGGTTSQYGLIYRTSKAGLNMALRCAAHPLGQKGVTVITMHPGHVETDMGGKGAPVKPADSAAGLIKVIDSAKGKPGELRFLDWQGETLPW